METKLKENKMGILCYKVVSAKYRFGTNAAGYIARHGIVTFREVIKKHQVLKDLFPVYKAGKIVKARPNSPGILCFRSEHLARSFVEKYSNALTFDNLPIRVKSEYYPNKKIQPVEIIKVTGYNEVSFTYLMSGGMDVLNFLDCDFNDCSSLPPEGAVGFELVEVLE
jgi:chaperonin GroEL (HSP60 family)